MAILIVDPCIETRQAAIDVIKWADGRRTIAVAESATNALEVALDAQPDLIFCEPALPDMSGDALCRGLRTHLPRSLFVAYLGDGPLPANGSAFDGVLHKPPTRLSILPHLHAAKVRRQRPNAPVYREEKLLTAHSTPWHRSEEPENRPWKILVRLAEEAALKFALPVPRRATVENVLRQIGKQSVSAFTLYRNHAPIPTELSTCVSDGDELRIRVANQK